MNYFLLFLAQRIWKSKILFLMTQKLFQVNKNFLIFKTKLNIAFVTLNKIIQANLTNFVFQQILTSFHLNFRNVIIT